MDYLCRAAALEHPELGPPPVPPTGQWAIDAGRSAPEESFVQAELVERIEDEEEDGEGSSFGDGMRSLFGEPRLDCQVI